MTSEPVRKAPPPAGLGKAGRRLWNDVARQVAGDGLVLDQRERRILRDAARTADDLERIEAALESAPVMVAGSTGQPVPNRLWDEARKSRSLIAALLRQLDLDDRDARTGRGSATTSTSARAAAFVRWRGDTPDAGAV